MEERERPPRLTREGRKGHGSLLKIEVFSQAASRDDSDDDDDATGFSSNRMLRGRRKFPDYHNICSTLLGSGSEGHGSGYSSVETSRSNTNNDDDTDNEADMSSGLESGVGETKMTIEPPQVHKVKNVLIVEDSPINARLLQRLLKNFGFEIEHALNGKIGVELYEQHVAANNAFDIVLMDCQMPVMDGFEATKRIREFEKSRGLTPCTISAVTAGAKDSSPAFCEMAGMNVYVEKPVKKEYIERVVYIAEHRQTQSGIVVIV
jgi:CheY-like chemotaxis protein